MHQAHRLLRFTMRLVLAAERAELFHREALGHRPLILCLAVIAVLAFFALELNDFAGHKFAFFLPGLLNNLGDGSGSDCPTAFADREPQAFVHGHRRN